MKFALLCDRGCEDLAATEVDGKPNDGYVTFDGKLEDIPQLCKNQLASRIIVFIAAGKIKNPEDAAVKELESFDFKPYLTSTFRAECARIGEHDFQAREVEEAIGALVHTKQHIPVDLKKPSMTIFCQVIDNNFVIGVDLAGKDLGKREYKVFHTRRSLRATIAYAALAAAGYTGKKMLVDPFVNDGAILIEAALKGTGISAQKYTKGLAYQNMPTKFKEKETEPKETLIQGFADSISLLKIGRSNAKLAGVDKHLHITKSEVDWMDTKLDKQSVDLIVTLPPCSGKNTPLKSVEKLQDMLFHQAKYVLKKNGTVLLVSEKRAEHMNAAEHNGFTLKEEREVWMGESRLNFLTFTQ